MIKTYFNLFMAFFRPGIFAFGGGPSAIPLIQKEVIDNYGWMTIQEYTDAVALGNTLPGPIATKLSALVGYKVAGLLGSVIAISAMVVPTALAIVLLYQIYAKFKDTQWLKGMMTAVRPVVVVLLFQTALSMAQKSFPVSVTWIVAAVAAVGLFYFKLHPGILIVLSMVFGISFIK